MKKILIALVLICGITIAAQNNTVGQEKTYTQREVDLMMQVQELEQKVIKMQQEIQYFQQEIELWKVGFNTEAQRHGDLNS